MPDDLDSLRHIEGFPIGEDEDILALSDPPYYTAYPNPHIGEIIAKWNAERPVPPDGDYHREPYVSDISEGKNDPIYRAHSYHTKVPYKAIMAFIEHYTQPSDIVLDGFCGTGMTGVAAQSLGRRAILCDLSPAASFVAYNYNTCVDAGAFDREEKRILAELRRDCSWMYDTWHPHCDAPNRVRGQIRYTVWSDVFVCPFCTNEVVYWDAAVDTVKGKIQNTFRCPSCGASLTKRTLSHATERVRDSLLQSELEQARQVPVLIDYSVGRKRHRKKPDAQDIALLRKIDALEIPYWCPSYPMPEGYNTEQPRRSHGASHVHHFFTKRNLWLLSRVYDSVLRVPDPRIRASLQFAFTAAERYLSRLSKLGTAYYFHGGGGAVNAGVSGTLYIPSFSVENNVLKTLRVRLPKLARVFRVHTPKGAAAIGTQSATNISAVPDESVDYIFTDPPFGDNLMYSELNFLWEAWLRVFTRNQHEAIMNKVQGKGLHEYRQLMTSSFSEMYRVLKPRRWITVVFHNSKASVWNAIQESLARAGFLVAQVTVLDKQQGSFKQVTTTGAVKNDLIINAYKPGSGLEQHLVRRVGRGLERDLVLQHLLQLPPGRNIERSKEMLYSKYLAYYVQRGFEIAYNADTFYRVLANWGLKEIDGYWFTPEQGAEYQEAKKANRLTTLEKQQYVAFVSDERSAIQWLWSFLDEPKTYDDIYTTFVKALQTPEDQIPELKALLEENFVRTNGAYKRPEALTKAEMETRRQEHLLHQFDEYLQAVRTGQRLKEVRKEAVVAGFTQAYKDRRWDDILRVGRRLDKRIVEGSSEIYDFIDIAETKAG